MKKLVILILGFFSMKACCQNEFAATAFYNDFKKIYADAQNGFAICKGEKRISEYEELQSEYKTTLILPLADSGKIVIPNTGNPYVIYYFEPSKVRLKVDQRALSLQEAILTAFEKPLYLRSETVIIKNRPLTNTYLFTSAEETRTSMATFRVSIYFEDGKYSLSLEIRGKG
ncbi:MAG: hypothetical protein HZB42_14500 [Sphingobacteriales bacterium]|nr:hypothetical protein [Sphingobacteriales bacterium]